MEAEALGPLDALRIDAAFRQHAFVYFGEVFSDDSDHSHRCKVTCCQREVRRRVSQAVVHRAVRGFDAVKRYRSYNKNRHKFLFNSVSHFDLKDCVWLTDTYPTKETAVASSRQGSPSDR